MYDSDLADEIARSHGYNVDDVTADRCAVIAGHGWSPADLAPAQVDRARFEAVACAETINHVLGAE